VGKIQQRELRERAKRRQLEMKRKKRTPSKIKKLWLKLYARGGKKRVQLGEVIQKPTSARGKEEAHERYKKKGV